MHRHIFFFQINWFNSWKIMRPSATSIIFGIFGILLSTIFFQLKVLTCAMGLVENIKAKMGVKKSEDDNRLSFACVGIDQSTLPDKETAKQRAEFKEEIKKEKESPTNYIKKYKAFYQRFIIKRRNGYSLAKWTIVFLCTFWC